MAERDGNRDGSKTVRPSRLRLVLLIILVAAAIAIVLLVVREAGVRRSVYTKILDERSATAARELAVSLRPVRNGLDVIRRWGENGSLNLADPQTLDDRFIPMVASAETTLEIASLSLVSASGREYLLAEGENGWSSHAYDDDTLGGRAEEWYEGALALEAGQPYWTDLDLDAPDDGVGVIAATAWDETGASDAPQVAAIGIRAGSIRSLSAAMPITENGLAILPTDDLTVLWFAKSASGYYASAEIEQSGPGAGPSDNRALVRDVLRAWHDRGKPLNEPLRLRRDGERRWFMFRAQDGVDGARDIGLLIPHGDLASRLFTVTSPFTYALFAVIGIGVLVLARLALDYRRRLVRISRDEGHSGDPEDRLRELVAGGEGEKLEFKSTLRWNLKTNKPGREIELAWLKTVVAFMNSAGGTLLIGVHDDGSVEGIGTDGFRNEDKYLLHFNNLINKHIGLEFARYLSFGLRPLGESRILVVDCRQSKEPAFLKVDEEEHFYVRIGPASRKLSLRKTLDYLKEMEKSKRRD